MKTGLLIKELRIKKGLTQEELASLTELSARTIQRIENGEVDPRAYTLQMIAKALEVDFSLFVEEEIGADKELQKIGNGSWSALIHLTGFLPLIFPTLILWRSRKDKTKDLLTHFHAAITLQLCIWVICLIGLWIYWQIGQPIPLIGGLLVGGLVSLINAGLVMMDKPFINPFIKRDATAQK